jgi:tetratricopeptide (TPR) repeat protein
VYDCASSHLFQESEPDVHLRFLRFFTACVLFSSCWYLTTAVRAQQQPMGAAGSALSRPTSMIELTGTSNIEIHIKGPNGNPVTGETELTLVTQTGQIYRQESTKKGTVRFSEVLAKQYTVLVVAPGFEHEERQVDAREASSAVLTIELRAMSAEDAALSMGLAALPRKAQKELGKALAALHANKPADARSHLETANKIAPNRVEVNYLFGQYSSQSMDITVAKSYWTKTLELNSNHLPALLSLGKAYLQEDKAAEALPYLKRAVEAGPTSWRAHAFLADAELRQGLTDDAIQHAERALELGHGQAENVQPFLAGALARRGEKDRAISLLQSYVKSHPADATVAKQLEKVQSGSVSNGDGPQGTNEVVEDAAMVEAASRTEISNWLPPDIDEKVPAVEAGAGCKVDDVLRETGKRIEEFVGNVDRFTATESVTHESINKWGMVASPERRRFDYLVSVREVMPGTLNVSEYRTGRANSQADFPGGVETRGLPAMVLIFHPYNVESFEMSCEGLSRWNGKPAWQVHFRQRSDKPNRIRAYRSGLLGPSYPIALKGRAWIAADTFRITRLETDLIAPVPEIRLVADHTAIEYGPVQFKNRKVEMWLPQTAEVYYDWRGKRTYRRHSFNNYLLFSVDDKQRISVPKGGQDPPADPAAGPGTAQP